MNTLFMKYYFRLKLPFWSLNIHSKKVQSFLHSLLPVLIFIFSSSPLVAQNNLKNDSTTSTEGKINLLNKESDTNPVTTGTYSNELMAGEFTPGKGFQIAKNEFASLNISIYGMVRYLNQIPGNQTWEDHLGRKKEFVGRNDFSWHRSMIWFTGHVGTPKFTYAATVWSILSTQQTLVYGNMQYKFNRHFRLGMGIAPNLNIRSMQGAFPYFMSTDRTMCEDAIRGGFTMGIFLMGEILPKLQYSLMLGNNLSTLGIKANKLTRDLAPSASVIWMPTTGEFGPRGGQGDFEYHTKLATRFGASYTHSREDRFNNTGEPAPDNTQVRMSDGVLFFELGALANGITVDKADFDMLSVDLGFKYRGLSVYAELYYRTLSNFVADGPTLISFINDNGYTFQVSYMLIPKVLSVYGINSMILDEFKRNPWEAGGGVNIYPAKSRSWRINAQCMHVYKCAAGGVFGLYTAGQTGTTYVFGVDILL